MYERVDRRGAQRTTSAKQQPRGDRPESVEVGGFVVEIYTAPSGFLWCRGGKHCTALNGPFRSRALALADAEVMLDVHDAQQRRSADGHPETARVSPSGKPAPPEERGTSR
jgi:hypothetical protein